MKGADKDSLFNNQEDGDKPVHTCRQTETY